MLRTGAIFLHGSRQTEFGGNFGRRDGVVINLAALPPG